MKELALVKLPPPAPGSTCYISMFNTIVHDRKDGKILVDYPTGLNRREPKWISEEAVVHLHDATEDDTPPTSGVFLV